MSLAIEDIRKNYKIENCEKNKYFSRYWNANVKHKQKKLNYYLISLFYIFLRIKFFYQNVLKKLNIKKLKKSIFLMLKV